MLKYLVVIIIITTFAKEIKKKIIMKKLLVILGISLLLGSCTVGSIDEETYAYLEQQKELEKQQIIYPETNPDKLYPTQTLPKQMCGKVNEISPYRNIVNLDDNSTNSNYNYYYVSQESYDAYIANPQEYACFYVIGKANGLYN